MVMRQARQALGDLARAGLVVTRKALKQSLADERAVSPAMVSDLVGHLHPDRIDVELVQIITETASTRSLRLAPLGGPFPPFRAGQFINLFVEVRGVATSRPYALSSSPGSVGTWDITVRRMTEGFVSRHLCEEAAVGDRFRCAGPAGFFYYEPRTDSNRLVFLAGGCGITPFMSMIRHAAERRDGVEMHLIYGNRVPDDIIFGSELGRLAAEMKALRLDVVISEPPEAYEGLTGFLNADLIHRLVGETEGRTFFVCGPHAMYDLCLGALRDLKVADRHVKHELSGPLPNIERVNGWPEGFRSDMEFEVKIDGRGGAFRSNCREPLLNSLERNGVALDCLCRSGECGVCRTRLVEGKVFMPESVSLRKTDAVFGYIHPCMAYPLSDITIRI